MSTQEVAKSPKVAKVAKKTPAKKIPSTHPKFNEMIKAGIEHLKERTGSSRIALLKYIVSTYKLDEKTANVHLKMALKRGVKDGSLKQVKGVGSNGSFKLADGVKKSSEGKKKVVKTTVAKPAVKKVVAKKVVTKKAAPEDKPKKNVKKVVKPKAPKPVAEKPAEPAKPVSEKPKATKTVKAVKKPAVKPAAKTDVKKATKTASKQKAKKN
ncbi:unnamed protein product [Brachionus calyciflorus]|uniref:H15 domain-containing protein n=1 Tax=Brachionus calyciflorus TaxID=104777 RepID=A0A813NNW6_9BILA|nr:unnamed protein product [Brachionus calyciflorus]